MSRETTYNTQGSTFLQRYAQMVDAPEGASRDQLVQIADERRRKQLAVSLGMPEATPIEEINQPLTEIKRKELAQELGMSEDTPSAELNKVVLQGLTALRLY